MDFHKPDNAATRRAAATATTRDQKAKYEEDHIEDEDEQEDAEEKKPRTSMVVAASGGGGRRVGGGGSGGCGSMSCCQADKCTVDLTEAKRYHRRHKVCEFHAKAPAVLVSGIRQRFCQQCSRFHELAEFDDTKRSCRRRLAGHNERRRKSTSEPNGGSGSSSGRVKDPGPHCRSADHERATGANRTGQMASYGGNSSFNKFR